MADAKATLSATYTSIDQRTLTARGTITFTHAGDDYPSGGFAVDFSAGLTDISTLLEVRVASAAASGYQYAYNTASGKLHIQTDAGVGDAAADISGAMPDGLVGTLSPVAAATEVVTYAAVYLRA